MVRVTRPPPFFRQNSDPNLFSLSFKFKINMFENQIVWFLGLHNIKGANKGEINAGTVFIEHQTQVCDVVNHRIVAYFSKLVRTEISQLRNQLHDNLFSLFFFENSVVTPASGRDSLVQLWINKDSLFLDEKLTSFFGLGQFFVQKWLLLVYP